MSFGTGLWCRGRKWILEVGGNTGEDAKVFKAERSLSLSECEKRRFG